MNEEITISRTDLYQAVWQTPISTLAKNWGVLFAEIVKACEHLNVPRPEGGHWSRLQHGQTIEQPALPEADDKTPETVTLLPPHKKRATVQAPAPQKQEEQKVVEQVVESSPKQPVIQPESELKPKTDTPEVVKEPSKVKVLKTLDSAHFLVKQCQKAFTGRHTRIDKGFVEVTYQGPEHPLSIAVSPDQVNRALRIMDAVIKAVVAEGARFERGPESWKRRFVIGKQAVWFGIREIMKRTTKVFTEEERLATDFWMKSKYDWHGSGKLKFTIYGDTWVRERVWTDSKALPLEDQLQEIVDALNNIENEAKKLQAESAERTRLEGIESARRHQIWLLEQREEEQRKLLVENSEAWLRVKRLRAFIRVCEKVLSTQASGISANGWEMRWLKWAQEHADRIDPVNRYLTMQKQRLSAGEKQD